MPKQPPWEIKVGQKNWILAEFCIPAHKMQANDLKAFLRALVVRYRTASPEEMASYYVNRTRGEPSRLPFAEVRYVHQPEQQQVGYWCGDWECYASAMQKIDASTAQWLNEVMEKSRPQR